MARIEITYPDGSTRVLDRIDVDVIMDVLDRIVDEYREGVVALRESGSVRGPFIDGSYLVREEIGALTKIYVEYRTTEVPEDFSIRELVDELLARIDDVIDKKVRDLVERYGYMVVDTDFSDGCYDYIIYVDGAEVTVSFCIDARTNTGCGFRVDSVWYPPLSEILSKIESQLQEIKQLEKLAEKYPGVAVVKALYAMGYEDIVKVMKLGNSRVVPTKTFELKSQVKRYVVVPELFECFERID